MTPTAKLALLLLAIGVGRPGHAAETFLDRSKVQEAVPYGKTLEPDAGTDHREAAPVDEDRHEGAPPPTSTSLPTPTPPTNPTRRTPADCVGRSCRSTTFTNSTPSTSSCHSFQVPFSWWKSMMLSTTSSLNELVGGPPAAIFKRAMANSSSWPM